MDAIDHGRDPRRDRQLARAVGLAVAAGAIPAAVLASPFWMTAALTRWLSDRFDLGPEVLPWAELLQYVPELGWHSRPNLDAFARAEDVFHLTTDAEGWRGRDPMDDADLLVFGDSYAFGHGVDDADMYSQHVPGHTVKPMGSDGYSMVHAVLWLERLHDRIAGKQVAWMVYQGNDLYDNLRPNYGRYRMPFTRKRQGRWEIASSHVGPDPWPLGKEPPDYLAELAKLCTHGHDSARALEGADYLIDRAKRSCSSVGAELTVLSVPRRDQLDPDRFEAFRARSTDPERFDPGLIDRHLRATCERLDLRFEALADHLRPDHYLQRDIHWTIGGNRAVGQLLGEIYR